MLAGIKNYINLRAPSIFHSILFPSTCNMFTHSLVLYTDINKPIRLKNSKMFKDFEGLSNTSQTSQYQNNLIK